MPHTRERRELVIGIAEVEITSHTYDTDVITGTPIVDAFVALREDFLHELIRLERFSDSLKEDFGPTEIPSLVLEKQEFLVIPTGIKGEFKMGSPIQTTSEFIYDPLTDLISIADRGAFEISWTQWNYWLGWIREFSEILNRFE